MRDLVQKLRAANTWLNEGDCCGQLDASGTCMAPACIFGEALKMANEAAARIEQLEAEAKTRALDYLEQLGQLSEELERVKREADRAQDAHGVRFLNYLEETARLADEVERLRSVLEVAADRLFDAGLNDAWADARAALEDKT